MKRISLFLLSIMIVLQLVAQSSRYAESSVLATGDWYKIQVEQSGIHKLTYEQLKEMYKIDISETDCHDPQEALERAQIWARSIYQTQSTTFLTNGSTSGILAAVLSCTQVGDKVLIASKL